MYNSTEQHDTLEVLLGIILAPNMDMNSASGMAPQEGSTGEMCLGADLWQGSSLSISNRTITCLVQISSFFIFQFSVK